MLRLTKTAETEAKIARVEARATGTGGAGTQASGGLIARLNKARTLPRGRLPWENGPRNGTIIKRGPDGKISNYAEYDDLGRITKRVDLTGASHNGIPTPHTLEFTRDTSPAGVTYARELPVRPATKDEVP